MLTYCILHSVVKLLTEPGLSALNSAHHSFYITSAYQGVTWSKLQGVLGKSPPGGSQTGKPIWSLYRVQDSVAVCR